MLDPKTGTDLDNLFKDLTPYRGSHSIPSDSEVEEMLARLLAGDFEDDEEDDDEEDESLIDFLG